MQLSMQAMAGHTVEGSAIHKSRSFHIRNSHSHALSHVAHGTNGCARHPNYHIHNISEAPWYWPLSYVVLDNTLYRICSSDTCHNEASPPMSRSGALAFHVLKTASWLPSAPHQEFCSGLCPLNVAALSRRLVNASTNFRGIACWILSASIPCIMSIW